MSIYDEITIVQSSVAEDTDTSFLGYNSILQLTKDAQKAIIDQKNDEQKNWMLTEVESIIKKAAEEGKYSISINVPSQYDLAQCQSFLQKAGYEVRSQGNRNLMISWYASNIAIKITPLLYDSPQEFNQTYSDGEINLSATKGINITNFSDQIPTTITFVETAYDLFTGKPEDLGSYGPTGDLDLLSDFNYFLITDENLFLPYIKSSSDTI